MSEHALTREQVVEAVLAKIASDPSNRDRVLAEVYAILYELDVVLAMMQAEGPGSLMRSLLGGKRKRKVEDASPSQAHASQDGAAEVAPAGRT